MRFVRGCSRNVATNASFATIASHGEGSPAPNTRTDYVRALERLLGSGANSSPTKDLGQAVDHATEFLVGRLGDAASDSFRRQRSDLADLDPGRLRKSIRLRLEDERKARPRLLTRESDGDHRSRPLVGHVVAQDEDRTMTCLILTARSVQAGPTILAPQYSGHAAIC